MDYYNKNADRFTGFADVYDNARPAMPEYPVEIISKYLGKAPETVIDLGCGTGLSSVAWKGKCGKLIGVEPSDDMYNEALKKADDSTSFIKGFGHDTGLDDKCADVVICSQSFHWMEPFSTLDEVSRILKYGGVFATVDCDWPPVSDWKIDKAYTDLFKIVHEVGEEKDGVKDTFKRFPKSKHLKNIQDSRHFRYAREIVFSNREKCTAERLIGLAMSQGSVQIVLKKCPEVISDELENFKKAVRYNFGQEEFEIDFCYRMRIAIK